MAWWVSPLNIRADQLQGSFRQVFEQVMKLPSHVFSEFICVAWAIWRVRNDKIMGGKEMEVATVGRYYTQTLLACQTNSYQGGAGPSQSRTNLGFQRECHSNSSHCYVDGSWSADGKAGVGVILTLNGSITHWVSKGVHALNATHAEASAVLEGYRLLMTHNCPQGTVLSDCLEIVDSLAQNSPVIHDWRSFSTIWECWLIQGQRNGSYVTRHCSRENNEIGMAHRLANLGRLNGGNLAGTQLELAMFDGL